MSKRIRKKKLRMQLIKALENMSEGEGIMIVGGSVTKFQYGQIEIHGGYSVDPDINIYASMKGALRIRNKEDVWKV